MDNLSQVLKGAIDAVDTASVLVPFLDVPSNGAQPISVLSRAAPYMNNTQNQMHYCNVMDDDPGQSSMPVASDLGTSSQETSFRHAMTLPSFVNTFTHKVDDLEGTVLAKIPMCPVIKTLNAAPDDIVVVPLCEYFALQYAMWKGSLSLKVQVICTSIQTGRLAICSHYGCSSDDVAFEDIFSQNCVVMEFGNGKNSVTVDIPYRSNHPWLKVPTYAMSNGGVGPAVDILSYVMGEVSIRVVTRMTAMASVAQQVDVNLYWSCGADIDLAYQSSRFVDYTPTLGINHRTLAPILESERWSDCDVKSQERKFVPQMMMGSDTAPSADIKDDEDKVALSNTSANAQGGMSYKPNQSDFIMLTHRFSPCYSEQSGSGTSDIIITTGDPYVQRTAPVSGLAPMSGSLWCSLPYIAHCGGMRFIVRCKSDLTIHSDRGTQLATNPYPYISPEVAGGGPVDYLTKQTGFNVMQFPMTIPNKFLILPKDEDDAKNDLCSAGSFIIHATEVGVRAELTVYAATADHVKYSLLSFVPRIHVTKTPVFRHVRSYLQNLPEFVLFWMILEVFPGPSLSPPLSLTFLR
jgi:hypothetical protein